MIYFLDSTKVPFIISHAHHAHVLLFLPCTVLSQSVLLGIRFIHKTFFFLFGEGGGGAVGGIVSPVSPCSTFRSREVQPLAVLYPTEPSPWRQVRKNIYSRVWTLGPTWSVLYPLVPSDWGIWASTLETDQDSFPGWLPRVPLDLISPQEGFSTAPPTPRFKCFPATRILPTLFVCFLCGTRHTTFMRTPFQLKDFIKFKFMVA